MLVLRAEKSTDFLKHCALVQLVEEGLFLARLLFELLVDFCVFEVNFLQVLHREEAQINALAFVFKEVVDATSGLVCLCELLEKGV